MCHEDGHVQYGIFIDATYYENLFRIHIPHSEG